MRDEGRPASWRPGAGSRKRLVHADDGVGVGYQPGADAGRRDRLAGRGEAGPPRCVRGGRQVIADERAEDQLEDLITYIHDRYPDVPVILDAKRGDIGATAQQYAREAFERYQADAVTLSPFMGFDSIEPYMAWDGKGLILLCRTSNPGGSDLQAQTVAAQDGMPEERLYERIARLAAGPWNRNGQLGLVVGATYPAEIEQVRQLAPTLPLLIPGIGAQGGDAAATVRAGWRGAAGQTTGPIIVSSSRAILYASSGDDFASAARAVAQATRLALASARGAPR